MRKRSRARSPTPCCSRDLREQRLDLVFTHAHEGAVEPDLEAPPRAAPAAARRRARRPRPAAGRPSAARPRADPPAAHLDAVDELGDGPLVDALLAEDRQDVRDVVHEGRVRPDDEDRGAAPRGACRGGTTRGGGRPPSCRCPARPGRRAAAPGRARSAGTGRPGSSRRCRACARRGCARAPRAGSRRRPPRRRRASRRAPRR